MEIIKPEEVSKENMKIHVSLSLRGIVISGLNFQQSILTNLTIEEEEKGVYIRKWSVTDMKYKKQNTFFSLWNKE